MTYVPTIGLEIHAELKTISKMFCSSPNNPDEANPNVNVCPICMGHPGTLPVANKSAIAHVLRVGTAVGGELADFTEFDRKNYFYPDLPKGYQISQFQYPLIKGGMINNIQITRIHLEEDTARSLHTASDSSIVDFNRAGVPLMELVTEPVIKDAGTAKAFAEELQRLLRYLGVSDANMEKGQMRVEANISVSKDATLGTKVEVKNLNSFRSVEKAIEYEVIRQSNSLEAGNAVLQETRGWNENSETTYSQRVKESSHDYRYFPDPDIPKFKLSRLAEFSRENLAKALPELPWQRRDRLLARGLDSRSVEILVDDETYAEFYATEIDAIVDSNTRKVATHILLTTIRGKAPSAQSLNNLRGSIRRGAEMYSRSEISSSAAALVYDTILNEGGEFEDVASRMKLLQTHDMGALGDIADEVIAGNPKVVADYQQGKLEALKFLVGQGMKMSKGAAHPNKLEAIFRTKLGG